LKDTDDFSFKSFMNYILFAPTLLTGPPLSYKNFISFIKMPTTKKPEIIKLLLLLASFELFQHYCPVISLNSEQSFVQAEVMALFHLVFIWYKFLIIWRVARVWAALCGIEVVDNLSRCVCNNYGF
jgi:D-alanyl-lipoteichoic acid acyltransferase DltB (MBOAT superfamily)